MREARGGGGAERKWVQDQDKPERSEERKKGRREQKKAQRPECEVVLGKAECGISVTTECGEE